MMIRRLGAALAICGIAAIGAPPSASAIGGCEPTPPRASAPDEGVMGMFDDRPATTSNNLTPENVWTHGGFSGMGTFTYDVGCWKEPSTYLTYADRAFTAKTENASVAFGNIITQGSGSLERKVWEPTWMTSFAQRFTDRAFEIADRRVWAILGGAGLSFASLAILYASRRGDMPIALSGVFTVLVIVGAAFAILINPAVVVQGAQRASSELSIALNNSSSKSGVDANMDAITRSVQYNSYLRRVFGDNNGPMAEKYGPRLLAASRLSWNEADRTKDDPAAREALIEEKADHFNKVMSEIKEENEAVYDVVRGQDLGGGGSRDTGAFIEVTFALVANFFRACAAFVMLVDMSAILLTSVIFVGMIFFLVTPPAFNYVRSMLDTIIRAVLDIIKCAVGLWAFNIWMDIALAPGITEWWSMILLLVGSILLWGFIRPDRALMSLLTFGRVSNYGPHVRNWTSRATASWAGNRAANDKDDDDDDDREKGRGAAPNNNVPPSAPPPASPDPTSRYEGTVIDPQPVGDLDSKKSEPTVVKGEVVYRSLPNGEPVYQRKAPEADQATPPPAGTSGVVEVYQRMKSEEKA